MHPRREQVVLAHALMKVGAKLLPLSPRLTPAERAAIVDAEEPIVDLDDAGELTQTEADMPLLGEHDMDEVCARVLTSGSTGTPHPVGLTYGNFLWSAVGSAFNIGVEPERPLALLPAPQPHLRPRDRRCARSSTAPPRSSTTASTSTASAAALESDEITVVSLVATMLTRLLEAGADLSGPRAILVGGGPVPERAAARRRSPGAPPWSRPTA